MAKTNQVIENKKWGDKCQFLITSEDSKGELMYREANYEFLEFPLMRKSAFIHFIEK